MAVLNFSGWGSGTIAHDNQGLANSGLGQSIQSTTKQAHANYALRVNPSAGGACTVPFGVPSSTTLQEADTNQTTVYFTGYFRYATLASGADTYMEILSGRNTSDLDYFFRLTVDLTGHLGFRDISDAAVGSYGATALSANTWYRIGVKIVTGATDSFEVWINGVLELSGNFTGGTRNFARLIFGTQKTVAVAVNYFWGDWVLDTAQFWGDPKVYTIKPTANGTTAQWTAGTGASDYTQVDEIPANDTDYIKCSTAGSQRHLVALEDSATVGITGTIGAVKAWVRLAEDTTVTSAQSITFRSNSTNYDSTGVNGTTTVANRYQIRTVDPNSGVAFTLANIDALEIGVLEANAVASRSHVIAAFVLSNPSSAQQNSNFLAFMR